MICIPLEKIASKKEKKLGLCYFTQVGCKPIFYLRRCCIDCTQIQKITCIHFTQVKENKLHLFYAGTQFKFEKIADEYFPTKEKPNKKIKV